jgi:hypothetical protein
MGGRISTESEGAERGAAFHVMLPNGRVVGEPRLARNADRPTESINITLSEY